MKAFLSQDFCHKSIMSSDDYTTLLNLEPFHNSKSATINIKTFKLKRTGASHKLLFLSIDTPLQNTLGKIEKSSKFRQERITLISGFVYFLSTSTLFCREDWTLDICLVTLKVTCNPL